MLIDKCLSKVEVVDWTSLQQKWDFVVFSALALTTTASSLYLESKTAFGKGDLVRESLVRICANKEDYPLISQLSHNS